MESLPADVLRYILKFIPYEEKNWLNIVMTSKHLYNVGSRYFRKRLDNANSSIYVSGGTDEETSLNTMEKYDLITKSWSTVPTPMRLLRTGHAVVSYREFLYIFAGRDDHAYNSVERFDTERNEWKAMAPLTRNRSTLSAARYRDMIYVLGGTDGYNTLNTVEQTRILEGDRCLDFDWKLRSPMKTARSGLGSAFLGDSLFVAGGSFSNSPLQSVERYDMETDTWHQMSDMLVPRSGLGVTAIDHNTLLAIGGWSDDSKLKTVEMYDSRINKWRSVAPMKTIKTALRTVTVGPYVYAIGGYDGEKPLSVVERYDPRIDVWENVGELKHGRYSSGVAVINVNV